MEFPEEGTGWFQISCRRPWSLGKGRAREADPGLERACLVGSDRPSLPQTGGLGRAPTKDSHNPTASVLAL